MELYQWTAETEKNARHSTLKKNTHCGDVTVFFLQCMMANTHKKQAKQIEKSKKIDHSVSVINFKVHHLGIPVPRYSLQNTQKVSDTNSLSGY